MTPAMPHATPDHVEIVNVAAGSSVLLICEHAAHHIPPQFNDLGMSPADRTSHAAWDPGAIGVAQTLSQRLDATLIAAGVSRLVYDCNRPPTAHDAMPERSETIEIPGNRDLSQADRDARVRAYYHPFHDAVTAALAQIYRPIIVTIHSFTPVYHGQRRSVEIGVLHDADARLADAMLDTAATHTPADVQRNAPYGPDDGVTHTLRKHAIAPGHLNVMLEIRNDLIATPKTQKDVGAMLAAWVAEACVALGRSEGVQCQA